jgi:hypothetical protein
VAPDDFLTAEHANSWTIRRLNKSKVDGKLRASARFLHFELLRCAASAVPLCISRALSNFTKINKAQNRFLAPAAQRNGRRGEGLSCD